MGYHPKIIEIIIIIIIIAIIIKKNNYYNSNDKSNAKFIKVTRFRLIKLLSVWDLLKQE